jgi:hypothetical protein
VGGGGDGGSPGQNAGHDGGSYAGACACRTANTRDDGMLPFALLGGCLVMALRRRAGRDAALQAARHQRRTVRTRRRWSREAC